MPDLRLVEIKATSPLAVSFDFLITPAGSIDETQALATAVIVALGTDARAHGDDELPDLDSQDRRGWWGDLDADRLWGGWPIGSRLWLLERAKITDEAAREGATIARIENYCREALRPFVAKKLASRFDVTAFRTDIGSIGAAITIYRGPLPAISLEFQSLWDEIGS